MAPRKVKPTVESLFSVRGSLSSGELAAALRISRQAAHAKLRRAVDEGLARPVGGGRSARYELVVPTFSYAVAGAAEDRIFADLESRVPAMKALDDATSRAVHYAATEMLNNAIDHSDASEVRARVEVREDAVVIDVVDDGVGAFERLRTARGLAGHVEAAADLTKGKVTTMPVRHSGEGIFFTSRVARRFELRANAHTLVVDNVRDDVAILAAPDATKGTHVRFEIARPPARKLVDVFAAYTEDHDFVRTRTVVRLFGLGRDFMSRSEARRLCAGLERFREVVFDFAGVAGVGQGFADEIFRVWANAHPAITLGTTGMNDDVRFFVERAIRSRGSA